jgi:hypothetical protein
LTFGRNSTSLQKDENSLNMETDDLLREVIKGQKNMAEKFTKDLKDLAEDFVEKLTAQTKAIVTIRQDIKVIKDEIKNLTQRVDVMENALSNIENIAITREELGEIERKKSEVIIFGLPELEKDLKTAVFDKLNKVTPTSMEEIKFIRKIGKASNGKIQPTLVVFRSTAKRETVLEGAHKVSYSIEPSLTKNQLMYKKKLKEQVNEKNSKEGGRVCKIAGPSDAPVIVTIKSTTNNKIVCGK